MALSEFFQHRSIKGKDVWIVNNHHKALAPWALIRRRMRAAPNLITIDHHTDTCEAFLGHPHWETHESRFADQEQFRLGLVAQIDWRSDASITEAIAKLKHDEHIDAATWSGILDNAFCIQLSDPGATPSIEELAFAKSRQNNWPNRPITYSALALPTDDLHPDSFPDQRRYLGVEEPQRTSPQSGASGIKVRIRG